jgi:hypothetical protein
MVLQISIFSSQQYPSGGDLVPAAISGTLKCVVGDDGSKSSPPHDCWWKAYLEFLAVKLLNLDESCNHL